MKHAGRVVAGVDIRDVARLRVVDAVEDGDEHRIERFARQHAVCLHRRTDRVETARAGEAQQGVAHRHEERGRHTLAGDIRHGEADVALVDAEEVVEVAADILSRTHGGMDVYLRREVGEGRELAREDGKLDLGR